MPLNGRPGGGKAKKPSWCYSRFRFKSASPGYLGSAFHSIPGPVGPFGDVEGHRLCQRGFELLAAALD